MKKYLFPALLVAIVSPAMVAKPLTAIIVALICIAYFQQFLSDKAAVTKLVIAGMLFPGTLLTFAQGPGDLLRLAPLWMLVLLYPYERMPVSMRLLNRTALWLLVYLVGSGILIGFEFGPALDFRARWYPMNLEDMVWNYPAMPGLLFMYGETRVAGLFYNPNYFASHIFFFYVVFFISNASKEVQLRFGKTMIFVTFLAGYGLYLSASRTFLLAFVLFLVWWIYYPSLKNGVKKIRARRFSLMLKMVLASVLVAVGVLVIDRIIEGFQYRGSASAKFHILGNYLLESSQSTGGIIRILFGGYQNRQFDAEWGYWIGAIGVIGTMGILVLYQQIVQKFSQLSPIILALVGAGFGSSILYALGNGLEVVAAMVTGSQYIWNQSRETKERAKKSTVALNLSFPSRRQNGTSTYSPAVGSRVRR